jgi:hypothetical protein
LAARSRRTRLPVRLSWRPHSTLMPCRQIVP